MEGATRTYLDTNIFVLVFEGEETPARQQLSELFFSGENQSREFVTSELTFAELLVLPYRTADRALSNLYERLAATNSWLNVIPVTMKALKHAARLRAQYASLKLPDAIHISSSVLAGCTHFLTEDKGVKPHYFSEGPVEDMPVKPGHPPRLLFGTDQETLSVLRKGPSQ